ncbi:MAG: hypothetical protein O3B08_03615 [Proteobacteria bacterium]|nr:hypothetical protein [Pseudomonadota bacterium]
MNLSGMIGSLGDFQERVRRGVRRRVRAVATGLCGALFILGAAGFGVAAGYMRLAIEMPAYQAALIVAACLLFVGVVIMAVARSETRRDTPAAADAAPDLARQIDEATNRATQEAMAEVRRSPLSAILTSVAVGAVVGLLRPNDDK